MLLVAVMIGWLLFTLALAAFASPAAEETVAAPIELGAGVMLTPAPGWTSAADVWEVEPNAVSLQRAGAIAVFAADTYEGTTEELFTHEMRDLEAQFDFFKRLPVTDTTVATDLPAVKALFSGTADAGRLEGVLVAAAVEGRDIVMLTVASAGRLSRVQADLDTMLNGLVVPSHMAVSK